MHKPVGSEKEPPPPHTCCVFLAVRAVDLFSGARGGGACVTSCSARLHGTSLGFRRNRHSTPFPLAVPFVNL
ncbi:unnamed protein product [Caenorhabditis auriculariae]|uniref:Uncharacterized protein n=1 Tax=Caenorhabditis auriculariae TaxID=2777116 RepID=A0A8S1GT27_9PELO|nr:unnamed protein product [Caenorhabditis auriculariae]